MISELKKINPSLKDQWMLYLLVAAGILVLSLLSLNKASWDFQAWIGNSSLAIVLAIWVVVAPILIFLFNPVFVHVYRLWIGLGLILGSINAKIILTLVYYVIFFPVGFCMRVFSKETIFSKPEGSQTYFTEINSQVGWHGKYDDQY